MVKSYDSLVRGLRSLLFVSCVEAIHVKTTTVFTLLTVSNNDLTILPYGACMSCSVVSV